MSLDIDELLVLVSLFIELPLVLLPVEPVALLPVVPVPLVLLFVERVPVDPVLVDEPVVPPVALPLDRLVVLLPVAGLPVVLVLPACGPEVDVLLLGEHEAPP